MKLTIDIIIDKYSNYFKYNDNFIKIEPYYYFKSEYCKNMYLNIYKAIFNNLYNIYIIIIEVNYNIKYIKLYKLLNKKLLNIQKKFYIKKHFIIDNIQNNMLYNMFYIDIESTSTDNSEDDDYNYNYNKLSSEQILENEYNHFYELIMLCCDNYNLPLFFYYPDGFHKDKMYYFYYNGYYCICKKKFDGVFLYYIYNINFKLFHII